MANGYSGSPLQVNVCVGGQGFQDLVGLVFRIYELEMSHSMDVVSGLLALTTLDYSMGWR